jgi:hypothetical protein
MAVRDRWTSDGKRIMKELGKLRGMAVHVGFTAGKKGHGAGNEPVAADDYEGGTTVAEVASWNEYGTSAIPSRPFMRDAFDKNAGDRDDKIKKLVGRVIDGSLDAETALKKLGADHVGQIQAEIRDGDFAPNAYSTVAAKAKKAKGGATPEEIKANKQASTGKALSTPLIDTGRMRQSVHYVIGKKGEIP